MSVALSDRGPAHAVPQPTEVQTSVGADELYLLQRPLRVGLSAIHRQAAPAAKTGEGRVTPVMGESVVRVSRRRGAVGRVLTRPRTSDSRHRAHRHPDATAPPPLSR